MKSASSGPPFCACRLPSGARQQECGGPRGLQFACGPLLDLSALPDSPGVVPCSPAGQLSAPTRPTQASDDPIPGCLRAMHLHLRPHKVGKETRPICDSAETTHDVFTSATAGPSAQYASLVKAKVLREDDYQRSIVQNLQDLYDRLLVYQPPEIPEPITPRPGIVRERPPYTSRLKYIN
jgi:hypothetical protein